jgi:pullulanase-type alpha-1,6-glucosidase
MDALARPVSATRESATRKSAIRKSASRFRRYLLGGLALLLVGVPAGAARTAGDGSAARPADAAGVSWGDEPSAAALAAYAALAQQAGTATARRPSAEQFYFALPDRFANGDRRNDDGGLAGDRLSTGLDPTDKGFYHGGDIKGVIDRLDYIAGLGTTAIWLAPIFKNRPVQGAGSDISAGYHGYWITDFTAVDPHFGTRADLKRLVRLAHARGIKIYLDIITNHTADVIRYAEDRYAYIDKATSPYVDAQGRPFEDRNYADGTNGFPKLDRDSFPYTPEFVSPADAKVKVPAWLNDPTMYHNRGDSTFAGENSEYGDFFGLDDLFTERPEVVRGMTEIYGDWVAETGVDGFRIDTAKHVNMEFWPQFASGVEERADRAGKPDFFMFGEVFDANPALTSTYVRRGGLPATLDFPFQAAAQNYVAANGSARQLADLYAADDLYTARDTDAGRLPTFLGNHDMGRIGSFIARGGTDPATHLRRDVLAHELMFLTRGQPVVYSGDEQGFTGPGGDKDARQDMFASRTPDYLDDDLLGTDRTHAEDSYDPAHPIYRAIADLGALRRAHPALTDGVQLTRYAADGPGVFAFSRIAADQRVEYLVAVNNADAEQTVAVPSASAGAGFDRIYPAGAGRVTAGADGRVELTVPGTSAVVYRADRALPAPAGGPSITIASPAAAGVVTTRAEVVAEVTGSASTGAGSTGADPTAAVAFAAKVGDGPWRLLGTADRPYETPAGAPARYRIYHDLAGLAGGVGVQYKAVVRDAAGRTASARSSATVGAPPQAAPRDWVVVHYHRPDGNYADWNLYTWGDVDEAWQKPFPQGQPFAGEDAYGRFAWVKLKPGARDVGFLVVNGAGEKDVAADRFVDPSRTGEVWLKSGDAEVYPSEAAATDRVTVHYSRPDGAYDGWGLHLWGDGLGDGVPTDWAAPRLPDGVDGGVDGAYWHVPVKDATKPVNFIVHRGDEKDPGPDMAVDPTVQGQAYVRSGDPTVHRTAAGAQGVAVLHYRRPAGDYAGWGLHVWDGAATPTEWTSPLPPAGEDAYGLIFRVPLAAGAEGLNYILHNGDTKDLPADQRLDLAGVGHEAWLQAGVEGYLLPAPAGGVTRDTDLTKARAHWIDRSTVAWRTGPASDGPASDGPATDGKKYDLVWSAAGNVTVVDGDLAGDFDSVPLHARPNGLTEPQRARFPHLWQHDTFGLAGVDVGRVREVLRGQVLVTERDHEGTLLNATAVQVPGALDDAYPGATSARLGPTFAGNRPTLAVWAPTARSVALELFDAVAGRPAAEPTVVDMRRDGATGVWNATGPASWRGKFYRYRVTAWQPAAQRVVTASVTDPYAVALAADSTHSQIVDLSDPALAPDGWSRLRKPAAVAPTKIHIQELSVRDFSIADGTVPAPERGTYAAFSRSSAAGMTHLRDLAGAGVTHLHLLPAFDFATIPERRADQAVPDCDLAALPPDSAEQQACVAAVAERDGYNWGYDPLHYTVPEGGYAVDPDGAARTTEFRRMVGAVNEAGLRVVMDVVYNHTSASGVAPKSVLDQIVPGYYHRLLEDGTVATSTCCANTAPEHAMMGKLVVDSIVTWAKQYKVDGFRFDLMGHHPKSNMLAVRAALDRLTPARDGVDGKSIYVYGEGWDFGEVAGDARFAQATQANMAGTGIGTFNDRLRDAVRGGGPFDDNPRRQGFGSGLFTDPNGDPVNGSAAEQRARLLHHHDQIKVGLTGNLAGYEFVDSSGARVTGSDVDYNGSPAGYNAAPGEAITYVDAHDNEILYDALAYKLPPATPAVDRARMQVLGLSTVILGQGVGFVTAGSERLRSKSLDRNSFNSGDWFNQIRWDCADPDGLAGNGFGAGLPPRADNEAKWPYARPLLADPALVPDCAAIDLTDARYRELLRIRAGSTLFGLETAAQVQRRVSFPLSGVDEMPGVLTMRLDGAGLRGAGWRSITVVFNATTAAAEQTVPALRGRDVALHPILRSSADPVLRSASFDRADGTFTVPARSVAVFVQS